MSEAFFRAWEAIENHSDFIGPLNGIVGLWHPTLQMMLLHLACAVDNLPAVKRLVRHKAEFIPDKRGRMPSLIAAEAEASEALQDFVSGIEERIENEGPGWWLKEAAQ